MFAIVFILLLILPMFILNMFKIMDLLQESKNIKFKKVKITLLILMEIGLILLVGYVAIVMGIIPDCQF